MIRVVTYGGLGNQMFQHALFVALRKKGKNAELSLMDFFHLRHHNGFNLYEAFHIPRSRRTRFFSYILSNFEQIYRSRPVFIVLNKSIRVYKEKIAVKYIERKEFQYDEKVFKLKSGLLIGTWQCESYFRGIKDILMKEFVFRAPTDEKNLQLVNEIKSTNSVSIHVRRGDFKSKKWRDTHFVIKDNAYYLRATELIEEQVQHVQYFIFSDDFEWVRENLHIKNCTYVDFNRGKASYIDMYLMSLCKHNIIANSTFSWWGAWLNRNENKIVIMPNRWLNNIDCSGIFVEEWIKLAV